MNNKVKAMAYNPVFILVSFTTLAFSGFVAGVFGNLAMASTLLICLAFVLPIYNIIRKEKRDES